MTGEIHAMWFCHQPFFIPDEEVAWRVDATYQPLIDAFVDRDLSFSLGITGGLLERIARLRPGFVESLRGLIRENRLALIGTALQHPILPLLGPDWARAHILGDISVRAELDLLSAPVFWPTELGWSMQVGALAAEAGYAAAVIDGLCRDSADTKPVWSSRAGRLLRSGHSIQRSGRPSRLLVDVAGEPAFELLVRERELSAVLVDIAKGDDRDERCQLASFMEQVQKLSDCALDPAGPVLLAEDAERLLPEGLLALLDLLDGLVRSGVRFCTLAQFRLSSSHRRVSYIPAGTMEGGLDLWEGSFDDRWYRGQLDRVAMRLATMFDPLRPKTELERAWRDRLLSLQDSGFHFWPFISRSRRPFFDGLQALDASIHSVGRPHER